MIMQFAFPPRILRISARPSHRSGGFDLVLSHRDVTESFDQINESIERVLEIVEKNKNGYGMDSIRKEAGFIKGISTSLLNVGEI